MEEEDTCHCVGVDTREHAPLPLCDGYQSQNKEQINEQHENRAYKSPFLTYGAEDEVRILLRHKLQFGLRAVEVPFAQEPSGTDGYTRLIDVITGASRVFFHSQQHLDTDTLVRLKHLGKYEIASVCIADAEHREERHEQQLVFAPVDADKD